MSAPPPQKKKKATKGAKARERDERAALAAFADSDVIGADDVLPPAAELQAAAAVAKAAFLANWTCL
jgi:hypothetical protein